MKMTVWEKTTEVEIDDKAYVVTSSNLEKLISAMRGGGMKIVDAGERSVVELSASAEQLGLGFREATGEDLLAFVEAQGGRVHSIERDPDSGTILALEASGVSTCEYDPAECAAVLESLEASAALPSTITGDLAQTSQSTVYTATGATASTTAVTLSAAVSAIPAGSTVDVAGAGIPAGTTGTLTGTALTLSQAATATAASVPLTLTLATQVLGMSEWQISWKRKMVEATTTDNAAAATYMGSTSDWTVKSKFMFLIGDTSQSSTITANILNPTGAKYWNFFATVAATQPAFGGYAIMESIDITAGAGKIVGLDCSLRGTGPLNIGVQATPATTTNTVTGQQAEV